LISVAFPVIGPKLNLSKGGENPMIVKASSVVIGGRDPAPNVEYR